MSLLANEGSEDAQASKNAIERLAKLKDLRKKKIINEMEFSIMGPGFENLLFDDLRFEPLAIYKLGKEGNYHDIELIRTDMMKP